MKQLFLSSSVHKSDQFTIQNPIIQSVLVIWYLIKSSLVLYIFFKLHHSLFVLKGKERFLNFFDCKILCIIMYLLMLVYWKCKYIVVLNYSWFMKPERENHSRSCFTRDAIKRGKCVLGSSFSFEDYFFTPNDVLFVFYYNTLYEPLLSCSDYTYTFNRRNVNQPSLHQ